MLALSIIAAGKLTYHARRRCSSLVDDECSGSFSQIENRKLVLGSLVGGQVESAEAAAHRGASADSGVREGVNESRRRD